MRKCCFFTVFLLSAAVLTGCKVNQPAKVVYTDVPPPLTFMTSITSVPADTYSQYMETYTPPTTTGTDVYYYHLPSYDVAADTNWYSIAKPDSPSQGMPYRDTAASMPFTGTESEPETDEPAVTTVPEEYSEINLTESATTETAMSSLPSDTTHKIELPLPDTGFSARVSADTAPTAPSVTSTVTTVPSESSSSQ